MPGVGPGAPVPARHQRVAVVAGPTLRDANLELSRDPRRRQTGLTGTGRLRSWLSKRKVSGLSASEDGCGVLLVGVVTLGFGLLVAAMMRGDVHQPEDIRVSLRRPIR